MSDLKSRRMRTMFGWGRARELSSVRIATSRSAYAPSRMILIATCLPSSPPPPPPPPPPRSSSPPPTTCAGVGVGADDSFFSLAIQTQAKPPLPMMRIGS